MSVSTPAQLADRAAEIRRLLDDLIPEYALIHDLGYRQGARGEVGRASGDGRPTEAIALSKQRDYLRKAAWGADEAMKDAVAALTLARDSLAKPLRDRQTWTSMKDETRYPPPMGGDEHKALQAKALARRERGEE